MDCEYTLNQIDFGFRPFSRLLLVFLKENPTSPIVKSSHFARSRNLHMVSLPRLLCPHRPLLLRHTVSWNSIRSLAEVHSILLTSSAASQKAPYPTHPTTPKSSPRLCSPWKARANMPWLTQHNIGEGPAGPALVWTIVWFSLSPFGMKLMALCFRNHEAHDEALNTTRT
jgi:hypothetical protein